MATVRGVFDTTTIGGSPVMMSPWSSVSASLDVGRPTTTPEVPLSFTIALPDQVLAAQNGAANVAVTLKAKIQGDGPCSLVKEPSTTELTFVVANPNAGQCPAGSSRVTSLANHCSSCVPNDTARVRSGSCAAGTVYENGYCLTCAAAAAGPLKVVAPKPRGPSVNNTLPDAPAPNRRVAPPQPGPPQPER